MIKKIKFVIIILFFLFIFLVFLKGLDKTNSYLPKKNINEIKSIGYPFGFKINAFEKTKTTENFSKNFKESKSGNPNEFLGKRNDLTPEVLKNLAKEFIMNGATIIGGCCETNPSHIKAFSELK